jgi:hypothetical protein
MAQATVEEHPELQRGMGPGLLVLFIVGDILGTGVYALTGDVAAEVGGAARLAMVIAFSYLELVTKALVGFIVMCSGITSAATASRFFASNFFRGFEFDWGTSGTVVVLLFMVLVADPVGGDRVHDLESRSG